MKEGQHKDAIRYLERARTEYPDNASILWNLGIAQAEIGNHREAVNVWERYHLDEYSKTGHKTYAFFKTKPGYDQVKTNVVNILEGKMKPVSGSSK